MANGKFNVALQDIRTLSKNISDPIMGEPYELLADSDGRDLFSLYVVPVDTGYKYVLGYTDRWQYNPKYSLEENKRLSALRALKADELLTEEGAAKILQDSRERPLVDRAMDFVKEKWESMWPDESDSTRKGIFEPISREQQAKQDSAMWKGYPKDNIFYTPPKNKNE